MDTRSIGMQRYHETAGSSSSPSFPRPPPINHRHHYHHHPNLPMQGVRGQNINSHPQVAAASYRIPTNPSHSTLRSAHNSLEMGHRHPVSVRSTGLRIYRPHIRGFVPEATLRQRSLPHLRVLRADVVFSSIVPFLFHFFSSENKWWFFIWNASIYIYVSDHSCYLFR